jgi:hypothetical protein
MRTRSPRQGRQVAAVALVAAALLAGCGDDQQPGLRPQAAPPSSVTQVSAAAQSGPVFKAEKRWTDAKGNKFTILADVRRPSNAGLGMCSMGGGRFLGPSLLVSVRYDGRGPGVKGPQITVNDRMVAFPHGDNGCSYIFAPSDRETFKPGDSHTYRTMVVPWDGKPYGDLVLSAVTPATKTSKRKNTELIRIPGAKLNEAQRLGPPPGDPATPVPGQGHDHGG